MTIISRYAVASCVVASIALCVGAVKADDGSSEGFYLSGAGGPTWRNDATSTPNTGAQSSDVAYNGGYRVAGSVGYDFDPIRADFEIGYSKNDVDSQTHPQVNGGNEVDGLGDGSAITLLINGYYDYHNSTQFTPFAGVGVGAARLSSNDVSANNALFTTTDDSDWVYAWSATAGLAYALTEHFDLTAEYKFLWTGDPEMTDSAGTTSESDGVRSHTMQVGVRFRF